MGSVFSIGKDDQTYSGLTLFCSSLGQRCCERVSVGKLSFYGIAACLKLVIHFLEVLVMGLFFLNRTSIGERCRHHGCNISILFLNMHPSEFH